MNKNVAIILGDVVDADAYIGISHYLKTNDFNVHTYCANTEEVKSFQGNKIIIENAASDNLDLNFEVIFLLVTSKQDQQILLQQKNVAKILLNAASQQKVIITLGDANLLVEDLIEYLNTPSDISLLNRVFSLQSSASAIEAHNTIKLHEIKEILQKSS